MVKEPEQQDLFPWKPEEKKLLWLWKIIKSKYFWLSSLLLLALVVVWFDYNSVKEFLSSEDLKIFFSKYWLNIFGALSLLLTFLAILDIRT